MSSSWLLLLLSAAILMVAVFLLVACVNCRNDGPLVSIQQTPASEDYIPSTDFRVVPTSRPHTDLTPMDSLDSGRLRPPFIFSSAAPPGSERRLASYTESGAESLDSDPDDPCDPGYILVLPDSEAPPTLSRASTPSSDAQHNYVNIEDNPDYVNLEPSSLSEATAESSAQSDEDESDDDEEGNYVNQPTMIHTEPSA